MRKLRLGMALILVAAAARAEEPADQPALVLQSGGHTAFIHQVLFRPDGKQVVTVSDDHTVRLWDRATGERLAVYRLPVMGEGLGMPRCAALSPDGATLAVGGTPYHVGDKPVVPVFLIDLDAGAMTAALAGADQTVAALAFSHDGKLLAGGDSAGKGYVWDVAGRKVRTLLEGHKGTIRDVAFSPDDKLLATASVDKTARLWDVEKGAEACKPMKHDSQVYCLAWHDNNALFTGGRGSVFINKWDRAGKHLHQFVRAEPTSITSISALPEKGQMFYTWSDDQDDAGPELRRSGGTVLVFKNDVERDGLTWSNHAGPVRGAVSPDGLLAATSGGDDWGVNLWTLKDGKMLRRLAGRGQTPFWAGWSPDGNAVGWITVKKALPEAAPPPVPRFRPFVKMEVRPPEPVKFDNTLQRSFNLAELTFGQKPDGKYQRAAHNMGDLRLAEPTPPAIEVRSKSAKKELVCTIKPPSRASSFTLLPGDRAAVGGYSTINLYSARTGELIRTLKGPSGLTWDLAPSPDGRYLLAAFADQILRVYDPEQETPLLSLFVAGSDWIAWTKEGYYAASPGGEKLMGWQVNHGLDQLGTFYPAEQFHDSLYRPDVIRRVLAEGSVEKAVAAADKESGKTSQAVALSLPPEVKLLTPAAGKLDNALIEVKAEAQSKDRPVVTMHLLLDGRPAPGAAAVTFSDAKAGDKQTAVWKVTLSEGEHHLAALAETDASLGASPEVVVAYQPASAPAEPLPTLYVLAVGINNYPGSLKLNWAVDDATAVQKAFRDGGAPKPYGKVETTLLTDDKATKEGILAGLDWLKEKMTPDDTAVVFYAGHGHRDKKTSQFYMLPVDVDVGDLPKTGVTGTAIKDKLKAVPGKVLMLLDACHSGSIGQSPADPASLTDDVQRQLAAPDCGVVVMCAAMAQEEAGEAASVKHGFFTAALLQGLGGEAPPSKDGLIHLAALDFYVEEAVAELSKEEQHVVIDRPSTLTSFPLVKAPAKPDEK